MKVAYVFIRNPQTGKNPLCYADIMVGPSDGDGILTLRGWKLMETNGDKWIAPPSQKGNNDQWYPTISFQKDKDDPEKKTLTPEAESFRNEILREVMAAYKKATGEEVQENTPPPDKKPQQGFDDNLGW